MRKWALVKNAFHQFQPSKYNLLYGIFEYIIEYFNMQGSVFSHIGIALHYAHIIFCISNFGMLFQLSSQHDNILIYYFILQ